MKLKNQKKADKPSAKAAQIELRRLANVKKALFMQGFFRTGIGEYGEGDVFLGLTVPQVRAIGKKFSDLPPKEIKQLLYSKYHEERLLAVILLVKQFRKNPSEVFNFYCLHIDQVNNWDLVDVSAYNIIGAYLQGRSPALLFQYSRSRNLWRKRIAIVSTLFQIKQNHFSWTLQIAEKLLHDPHDLIHKAVGWMLREVGKRDEASLIQFLDQHAAVMPRTMLRYSLEKLNNRQKKKYMNQRSPL